jgi:hypothetical protein
VVPDQGPPATGPELAVHQGPEFAHPHPGRIARGTDGYPTRPSWRGCGSNPGTTCTPQPSPSPRSATESPAYPMGGAAPPSPKRQVRSSPPSAAPRPRSWPHATPRTSSTPASASSIPGSSDTGRRRHHQGRTYRGRGSRDGTLWSGWTAIQATAVTDER